MNNHLENFTSIYAQETFTHRLQNPHVPFSMEITCWFFPLSKQQRNSSLKNLQSSTGWVDGLCQTRGAVPPFFHWVRDQSSAKKCESGLLLLLFEIPYCQFCQCWSTFTGLGHGCGQCGKGASCGPSVTMGRASGQSHWRGIHQGHTGKPGDL